MAWNLKGHDLFSIQAKAIIIYLESYFEPINLPVSTYKVLIRSLIRSIEQIKHSIGIKLSNVGQIGMTKNRIVT